MPTHGAAYRNYSVNTAPRALSDVTPVTRMKLGFSCKSFKVLELLSVVENIGGGCLYTHMYPHRLLRVVSGGSHSNAGDCQQRLCHQRWLMPTGCPARMRMSSWNWAPLRGLAGRGGFTSCFPCLWDSLICTVVYFSLSVDTHGLLAAGVHRGH